MDGTNCQRKCIDEVHEYKAMMEEYVCKRCRRGVVKEMVSGFERGNWQRPNVVLRGKELRVGLDFLRKQAVSEGIRLNFP